MPTVARGHFTVEMKPQPGQTDVAGVALGRMSLDKRFEGDLVGSGQGEMLTALTPVKGSAGYVAVERFTGTLHGQAGSFVFQHSGTMDQGAQRLAISVVPDSGTEGLTGLRGTFKLNVAEGRHTYEFKYTLPK
jgi:Protein of unknown function (DUF3224)